MEQRICPVDVIAVCNADGNIRPLRLRLEDEADQPMRIDIDEVVSVKEIRHVGVESFTFLCRAAVRERQWLFELRYSVRSHSWSILRRLC